MGESYCTCPDFRKMGTCKHILYALERGRAKFPKAVQNTPAIIDEICLYLAMAGTYFACCFPTN